MGRWRPPAPKKSAYITREGYERLDNELKNLWKVERPEVTQKVQEAAAQGDRSENASYIYGKQQLRKIDRRVRYLSKRLNEMTVVDTVPNEPSKVFFGAYVTVQYSTMNDGSEKTYRIVGPDEINDEPNYISVDSPLARALLGKQIDDAALFMTPAIGEKQPIEHEVEILAIDYQY